jgi:hypothetical protein
VEPERRAGGTAQQRDDPLEVCGARLGKCEDAAEGWRRRDALLSALRLAVVAVGIVAAWLSVQNRLFSLVWLLLPLAFFLVLLVIHGRIVRQRARAERSVSFYRDATERIRFVRGDGSWPEPELREEEPRTGEEFLEPEHRYAADLDLFGRRSIFALICRARTSGGRERFATWLLAPADRDEVLARQAAVRELAAALDWRERWAVLGGEVDAGLDATRLRLWAQRSRRLGGVGLAIALPLLAVLNVVAALGWALLDWGPAPLLALFIVEILGHLALRSRKLDALEGVDRAASQLELLSELLELLEEEEFASARLRELRATLSSHDELPSRAIRQLQRRVDLLESRRNPFFAPIGAFFLWTSQWLLALERWRQRNGASVGRWLDAVAEIDALATLGGWSFENPEDPFPDLTDEDAPPLLDGRELGHPLLPRSVCVTNDVELGASWQAKVVSGSNMSGKSTYLRVAGVNVVLALAGAPIRGRSMRLGPLAVGASIRIQDSLQEGSSKFYAEIKRLRAILELAESEPPALFLLDEILAGTNSHDRRIGADAVLRALLARGAIGLVTTHDLALTRIAEDPDLLVCNVHFEDRLEAGRIVFDYRLRDGVVERSNALALMREVGLEV